MIISLLTFIAGVLSVFIALWAMGWRGAIKPSTIRWVSHHDQLTGVLDCMCKPQPKTPEQIANCKCQYALIMRKQ